LRRCHDPIPYCEADYQYAAVIYVLIPMQQLSPTLRPR
jgi:hypothetical protein